METKAIELASERQVDNAIREIRYSTLAGQPMCVVTTHDNYNFVNVADTDEQALAICRRRVAEFLPYHKKALGKKDVCEHTWRAHPNAVLGSPDHIVCDHCGAQK